MYDCGANEIETALLHVLRYAHSRGRDSPTRNGITYIEYSYAIVIKRSEVSIPFSIFAKYAFSDPNSVMSSWAANALVSTLYGIIFRYRLVHTFILPACFTINPLSKIFPICASFILTMRSISKLQNSSL